MLYHRLSVENPAVFQRIERRRQELRIQRLRDRGPRRDRIPTTTLLRYLDDVVVLEPVVELDPVAENVFEVD